MRGRGAVLDRSEIELLRAFAAGKDRAWIIAHPNAPLSVSQRRKLSVLLRCRASGVPIAYLTGSKEFFGRTFAVEPGVLVPRPETEHLLEEAHTLIGNKAGGVVVDVGTGSGCIGITVACERPHVTVLATDQSKRALSIANRNRRRHDVPDRVRLFRGNLLLPIRTALAAHPPLLILANLPYATPNEYRAVRHEPRAAIVGGRDGLGVYRQFFAQIQQLGITAPLLLEVDPRRAAAVARIARHFLRSPRITVIRDLAGQERVLTVRPAASSD